MPPPVFLEIIAESGSFDLTGKPIATRRLDACASAFLLTGSVLEFGATNTLMASVGTFGVLGDLSGFTRTPPALNAQPMLFVLDGYTMRPTRMLSAGSASYVMDSLPTVITPPPPARWFGPGGDCVCDCCVKPHVDIRITGANVAWEVTGADTATLTYACNDDDDTIEAITLTAGAASGTLPVGSGNCYYQIDAENECGETTESVRTYAVPYCHDCLHEADEPPTRWGRVPRVVVTIEGTLSAPSFDFCSPGSTFCPTIGFSVYMDPCTGTRLFRQTQLSGCFNYATLIEIAIDATGGGGADGRVIAGVGVGVFYRAYWYRARFATTNNLYPALTEILPAFNNPPPFQADTTIGRNHHIHGWSGFVRSETTIDGMLTLKCPASQQAFVADETYSRCYDYTTGINEACGPLVCIPDFTISATWG